MEEQKTTGLPRFAHNDDKVTLILDRFRIKSGMTIEGKKKNLKFVSEMKYF